MLHGKRKGFTLVELIVVLTIIVVVSVIVIPFISATNDKDIVPRGARELQAALIQARSRAKAEGIPNGVRLVADNKHYEGLTWCDQYEFVHETTFVTTRIVNGKGCP